MSWRFAADAGSRGHIGERAVPVVVVKGVPASGADEQIFVSVVVVVADCDAEVEIEVRPGEAGFRRDVLKGSVTLLMQQAVVIGGIRLLQFRQAGAVGEEDIQTAVVIVIEDSDSAAHRLWKILAFVEAVVGFIRDFRAWSDIHKSWPLGGCRGTSCHQSQGQEHASASENKDARALRRASQWQIPDA